MIFIVFFVFLILSKYSTINMIKNNIEYFLLKSSNVCVTCTWLMGLKICFSCSNIMFLVPMFLSVRCLPAVQVIKCTDFLLNKKGMFSKVLRQPIRKN